MSDELSGAAPTAAGAAGAGGIAGDEVDVEMEDDLALELRSDRPPLVDAPPLRPEGARHEADEQGSGRKPKPRMHLRIPDDEVARPRHDGADGVPLAPSRIITLDGANRPSMQVPMTSPASTPPAAAAPAANMSALGSVPAPPMLSPSTPPPPGALSPPRAIPSMPPTVPRPAPSAPSPLRVAPPSRPPLPIDVDSPDGPTSTSDIPVDEDAEPEPELGGAADGASAVTPLRAASHGEAAAIPLVGVVPPATESSADRTIENLPALGPEQAFALTQENDVSVDIPVDADEPSPPSEPEISAEDVVSVESLRRPAGRPAAASHAFIPPGAPVGMQSAPDLSAHIAPARVSAPPPPPPARESLAPPPPAAPAPAVTAATLAEPLHVPPPPSDPTLSHLPSPPAPRVTAPPPAASSPPVAASHTTHSVAPTAEAARKRVRPWWEELFNDDYIRTMARIDDGQIGGECDFIEDSLGVAKGAMVLDLACGTGRHAIELTRRGYQVVGYDLSLAMLAKAADEAQDRDQKLNFLQGDMRDMTFEDTFDGVYCWNTSFGFFEEERNAQVVSKVHRALRMGGQFLLDVVNRDFLIRQAPSLAWFEGDGCICMDEMQVDWITSRMRVKRTMMMDDGRSKEIEYSVRVYSLHELGKILHDHGFRVAEVSGRTATPGVFFGNESPRVLILAEKR